MFLTYKKGLKKDGTNPTILYGYGGFDASMTPNLPLPPRPGCRWVASMRWRPARRREYGEEWHLAGTKLRKQNVLR
jgi:prolyl oligopeptidase